MRTSSDQLHLFARASLSDALRAHSEAVPKRIQSISESVLRARPESELLDELVEELKIVPLEIDETGRRMTKEEVEIDVSGDPRRDIFPSGRKVLIPGIKVVVSVPFQGDHQLWHLQPSTYTTSPPRATVSTASGGSSGTLEMVFKQPADEPLENIKTALDQRLKDIRFYIANQRNDLSGYEGQLRRELASAIADRRSRLAKHDDLAQLLGIPEVKPATSASQVAAPTRPPTAPTQSTTAASENDTWDVFVSHASEDKDSFARPLTEALRAAGLKVWFDETTLKVGDSLRRSIDRGLAKSRFGIVIVSKAFLAKEWPQRELDGLVAREDEGRKVILPIWHEITAADVRLRSPTLADRLAVPSSRGIAHAVAELLQVIRPA